MNIGAALFLAAMVLMIVSLFGVRWTARHRPPLADRDLRGTTSDPDAVVANQLAL